MDGLLGGLDPDQRRAVTHEDGPLLVVAGAGTGKTQVITRRIAWLIATRRAKPSEILALTFTDKAADEMTVRVDQLVPYGYTDTAIATFHAFGDRLIREHALELGLPPDVRVLSRAESVIFLREHLFEFDLDAYRPLGDPTRFLSALVTLFSRCKDEDVTPDDVHRPRGPADGGGGGPRRDGRDRCRRRTSPRRPPGRPSSPRAYARYQELLAANGFIDFGDQVALALRLVRESPAARSAIAGRFRYILVDEFQDTNRAQAELVTLLAEPHRNVTVVGDDDQAIYAFRGAAIDNILDFGVRYPDARTVVLRRNYRSLAPILDAAYRLVRFNDPDRLEVRTGLTKRLRAERREPCAGAGATRGLRHGVGGGRLDRRRHRSSRSPRAPRRATTRSSSGRTVTPTRSCAPSTSPASRGGSPARPASTPGPRSGCSWPSFGRSPTRTRAWTCTPSRRPRCMRLGAEDLSAIVNMARRRNRSMWDVLEELEQQPGILRLAEASRAAIRRLVGGHHPVRGDGARATRRRGPVRLPA